MADENGNFCSQGMLKTVDLDPVWGWHGIC